MKVSYSRKVVENGVLYKKHRETAHVSFFSLIARNLDTLIDCQSHEEKLVNKYGDPDIAKESRDIYRHAYK